MDPAPAATPDRRPGLPELYDPSSGTWAATGSAIPSSVDTATLLRDGTVLVALDGRAAALYGPATGSWIPTATGSTVVGGGATATLLADGTVLVAGGDYPATGALAELYHPGSPPLPLPAAGDLAPGTYFLANPYLDANPIRGCNRSCSDYQRIIFTLPAGWATSDGLVYKHLDQPGEVAFSAWTVDMVYADPCHWQGSVLSRLDLRDHTHDATGAIVPLENGDGGLAHQVGRNASALTQVTLGGQIALKVALSTPAQLDVATCDRGQFRSWAEWDVVDGANSHNAPGQMDVVYMVDVDRMPLVIDASHMPATSEADLAELQAILASMIIDRGS